MKAECYGAMYPPVGVTEVNRNVRGKVFGYHLVSRGLGIQGRTVDVDAAQWESCLACPEFDGCFALSLGKLALEQAVAAR
jgi:hypothetical protein